jgi:uncharacterized phage infection (PIP) family protein YhgE
MHEMVASVKRVTGIMEEITAASQEQSAGIEQVNQAITQMDQVTQQNAALVEEAAAAAESLRDQAGKLAQVVSVFKLNGIQTAVVSPMARERSAPNAKVSITPLTRKTASKVVASPQRKRIANAQPAAAEEWEEF